MSLPTQTSGQAGEPIRQRLVEISSGSDATARAGQLLGKLSAPPPLSAVAFARIESKVLAAGPTVGGAASLSRWLGIGAAVVAIGGSAMMLAGRGSHKVAVAPQVQLAPQTTSLPVDDVPSGSAPSVAEIAPDEDVAAEPAPAALRPTGTRGPRVERARKLVAPAPIKVPATPSLAPPPVEESSLLAESKMLGQALHQLHQEHDAQGALASLSTYETRFPKGLLGEEAQAARVDALLALSRRDEALALLDRVTFTRLARGGELRAVRGELRARTGRCREAIADFGWALSHQPTTGTTERALYGRAACNKTLHDVEGARADYGEYLQRFPAGKLAAAAEAALRELPSR